MLCLSWVWVHLIQRFTILWEKKGSRSAETGFQSSWKVPSFPRLPFLCFNSSSPHWTLSKHLSPPAKQAKDWAGHRVLPNLSVNKICNDGLLREASTEFRQLVSLEKSCLAWAETNQNRELRIRVVLLIICSWQQMKESNISPRCWGSHTTTQLTSSVRARPIWEVPANFFNSPQWRLMGKAPHWSAELLGACQDWVQLMFIELLLDTKFKDLWHIESPCCQGAPVECRNQTLGHYQYYMVSLRGGTLSAAKEGTENFQEIILEADLARGVDENGAKGPRQTLVHVLWARKPHAIPVNRIWRG